MSEYSINDILLLMIVLVGAYMAIYTIALLVGYAIIDWFES